MTLGGFLFVKDAIRFDYCFQEAIMSMLECCDKVVVVDAGSSDGTKELLEEWETRTEKLTVISYPIQVWDNLHGKTKLAYFQNAAADFLDTDYQLLIQADEVLSEDSYEWVRDAIESGAESVMCARHNLWGSPYTELNVPINRMPCSPQVVRLSKRGYKTWDDGENIACPSVNFDFVDKIHIWHMGFVRSKEVMKEKIINMQRHVFEMSSDPKLDEMEVFDWRAWFGPSDLKPINGNLPRVIQKWALDRE